MIWLLLETLQGLLEYTADDFLLHTTGPTIPHNIGRTAVFSGDIRGSGLISHLPLFINRIAIYNLWPSIHVPRTRRTFGCLDKDMSCVSRWRSDRDRGGKESRSSTFKAHARGFPLGGLYCAAYTMDDAPKPIGAPTV